MSPPRRRAVTGVAGLLAAWLGAAGCAARVPPRPAGAPQPDPAGTARLAEATAHCAGLRTLTATLRLRGQAGAARVRARVLAGLAAPAAIRLEALAPFGPPLFVLAGRDDRATLLVPRESEFVPDTPVPDVLDALTGLALGAGTLRRLVAGCPDGAPRESRRYAGGWIEVTTGDDARALLREQAGAWRVVAIDQGPWHADYALWVSGVPRQVRVRGMGPGGPTDLVVTVDDLAMNVDVPAAAFAVTVPPEARAISLEALRSGRPLGPEGTD